MSSTSVVDQRRQGWSAESALPGGMAAYDNKTSKDGSIIDKTK